MIFTMCRPVAERGDAFRGVLAGREQIEESVECDGSGAVC